MSDAILLRGEAATILRQGFAPASVDMIYLDPPFGTQQIWTGKSGSFSDRFSWDARATSRMTEVAETHPHLAALLRAAAIEPSGRSYLLMMTEMMVELRRVLRPTGSLWLHCDDTMGHYLCLCLAGIFGINNDLGQVIWKRTASHNMARKGFGRVHDTIIAFARTRATRWRLWRCKGEFVIGDPCGELFVDGFADDLLNAGSKERAGYPTQKPVALLERLIRSATLPGDTVLDPTCGSGTTLVAAERLGRRSIGIDMSADAIAAAQKRLTQPARSQGDLFGEAA